jgi:imidazolonepropionase-like amidohydrolase
MQVLQGARLFDGSATVDEPLVAIEHGRVVAVGSDVSPGGERVDLGDVTLLPGLIDTHQHLCFDGGGTLEQQVARVDDVALEARARDSARRALHAGITTLRDLGDRAYVTVGLRDDVTLPTVLSAGPPITRVNGHCWYLGGECDGDRDLRRAVAERAERGCDVVKVMVSGGALTPTFPMWESQFTVDELRVIVDDAHARGLPVAAHCHATDAIESAVDAGVDSIEHCTFFTPEGRSDPSERVMARIAAAGIAVSSTMGRLPETELTPLIAANIDAIRESRRRLLELGATIVAGTDAGINDSKPHDVLPHALVDFIDAGMSATDGLRALTSVAAGVIAVADRKGRLAAGYDADILAVNGDPATDPAALRSVVGVWRAGERVV